MNFINEYALLFAVALPVAVVVGIQVMLFLAGERDTLLVPGMASYPSIELAKKSGEVVAMPAASPRAAMAESSNDETEREAA